MSNSILKKFAEELKKSREESKLSIDQIFTKTRIDKKYLDAIEDGNFSILPDVYIRAFIKEYANTIGLDPTETLRKFELAQKDEDYSVVAITEDKSEEVEKKKKIEDAVTTAATEDLEVEKHVPQTSSNKTFYYILAGILILLTIFVIYKTFLSEKKTNIITEKPFEEIIESKNKNELASKKNDEYVKENLSKPIITPKKDSVTSQPVKKLEAGSKIIDEIKPAQSNLPINLTIYGLDQSWIRVVTDEKENTEFIIKKNMKKVFSAQDKIYLHIGNSGGIKLELNNKKLNFSGAAGKVRKIFVTKDGIEYLRRTPVMRNEG